MGNQTTSFQDIMQVSQREGGAIHVVIEGGRPSLEIKTLSQLRPAPFKYHPAANDAHSTDCVPGDVFRQLCRMKEKEALSESAATKGPKSPYYHDVADFRGMVNIARAQGDGVVVGVDDGGANAFQKFSAATMLARDYKWDFTPSGIYWPGKTPSNWMKGTVFLQIAEAVGALRR